MKIQDIYRTLCRLYEPSHLLDIERYLILAIDGREYDVVGNHVMDREALIVKQSGGEIELGLYISPEILMTLEDGDPLENLDEFGCAIEGVSHLLYVSDRAAKERSVSMLELELQAEVDKFIVFHLLASSCSRYIDSSLFAKQFEEHSFDPSLEGSEVERYATASHFAAKYCNALRQSYFNPTDRRALTSEARRFFSGNLSDKLRRLIP